MPSVASGSTSDTAWSFSQDCVATAGSASFATTVAVAALVRISELPRLSLKLARTFSVLPSSAACTV